MYWMISVHHMMRSRSQKSSETLFILPQNVFIQRLGGWRIVRLGSGRWTYERMDMGGWPDSKIGVG